MSYAGLILNCRCPIILILGVPLSQKCKITWTPMSFSYGFLNRVVWDIKKHCIAKNKKTDLLRRNVSVLLCPSPLTWHFCCFHARCSGCPRWIHKDCRFQNGKKKPICLWALKVQVQGSKWKTPTFLLLYHWWWYHWWSTSAFLFGKFLIKHSYPGPIKLKTREPQIKFPPSEASVDKTHFPPHSLTRSNSSFRPWRYYESSRPFNEPDGVH